ncbi:acetyl-CoA carboxylase biotin carboxylase subunit [Lysinibacillus yapensis]|uniref:biotin carboxylase n=1 Tax=Ureibacillus yapensis TaxID=2304605 RepID=A0A396SAZ5_9BACL|nr:acetyl-CoA carboxylase biotin carboxylase subunit [Lysinibacillus yapensis]RHW38302.1 acetyl-CoA carboxylase biotin carboxylase subunit [Lysinibacillus yapensis]
MFRKILVANRGEIARRIIRTCGKMGIETVAVYSEADQDSLHVKEASESYCIGKSPVAQSYLKIEAIINAALQSGAQAIHPGYGLLSENAEFARQAEESGLVFIGPSPSVIAALGSKLEARKLMQKAGVPILLGVNEPIQTVEEAVEVANQLRYPLMLKASAGGGGIGMQRVENEDELRKAFEGNQKRAQSFFNDGTMFLEKFISEAHHIEVQIMADHYGNVVPIFERECSIQRRNQKVVEEAPSPFISEITRQKMMDVAVAAAKSIGYTNAGTVEFLVNKNQNFYFLEMNTRLQVEHPVTEEITGLDLVEQQIRVAYGEPLSFTRDSLAKKGHAIEVRIYAENPNTFYPSPGTITKLVCPEMEGIRHEIAVETGSVVSPFYDPMIAKCIATGENRQQACEKLAVALQGYMIEGIETNIPMLLAVITHPQFLKGVTTTKFVDEYYLLKN